MPVPEFTYVYMILVIADIFCILLAVYKKDYNLLPAFCFALPWLLIGLSVNIQVCPMQFCIGQQ